MLQIRPITDLRNTNEISELCHKNNEPIYITPNGYGDLVVMSIETYEKQFAMLGAYKKLSEAEQELSQGTPLLDGDKVFKRLSEKYVRE